MRFGEMRFGEMGFGEVGFGEMGFGEVGFGEMTFGEMRFGEMRFGEIRRETDGTLTVTATAQRRLNRFRCCLFPGVARCLPCQIAKKS